MKLWTELGLVLLLLYLNLCGMRDSEQVVHFMLAAMAAGDFYIICPDNDVTRDTDNRRILRAAEDIIRKPPGAVTLASGLRRRVRRISDPGSAVSALTDEGGFYDRIAKARTRAAPVSR